MSHEIRTPLTAVIGFAGLMQQVEDIPQKAREYLQRIAKGSEALNTIVNNVLDFSKVEAGQVELKIEPVALRELIGETAGLVEEEARSKGLLIRVEAGAAPELVMADAGRLRQVLGNLVTNAVKFTERGGVTVEADYEAADQRLRVTVRDSGVGVPADMHDRLFQRFSQIDGSNARRFGGAGLGLAISKGLVELMGGEIGFESRAGVGSTFWFTVPMQAIAAHAPAAAEAEPQGPSRRMRVLVVDDAPMNRELIQALLNPFDLETEMAADGREAVAAAERTAFDLVLMDLQMPGMDGIAAARAIRSGMGPNRDTPILAVSASVQLADVEACHEAGMNDHVPKPISARELLTKVAFWTSVGKTQAA
jgi:CheY-like chemotaxis protein